MKLTSNRFFPSTLVVCLSPLLAALTTSTQAAEATFSSGAFTSDATSGVSSAKTYTALGNVVGGSVTVNGATFLGGTTSGTGWSLTGIPTTFASGGNKTTTFGGQAITGLFDGFQYAGNPGLITMSGLTVGQTYVSTVYCQDWSWPATASRVQTVAGTEGAPNFTFNEDALEASMLRYTFVASATTMSLKDLPVIPGNSLHLYGLSNEQVFNKSWSSGADWTTATWSPVGAPITVGSNANFTTQGAPTGINLDANVTTGHVQFNGANAWTLSTANASTLTLQTDAAGVSVLSTPSGSHTISTAVTLNSDVMKSGPGTLTLGGAVSGAKGINITGGKLRVGSANSYAGVTTVGAGTTLDLNDSTQSIAALNGAGTLLNDGTTAKVVTVNSGSFSGNVTDHTAGTGTVALTKATASTLTLSNASTYTGLTNVNDGVLRLEGSGSPLITDNFYTTGSTGNNLNYNLPPNAIAGLPSRQTGSLATQNWTLTGNAQTGNAATNVTQPAGTNGDYMLLAFGATGSLTTSLSTANSPGPVKINFDMFKGNASDTTSWTSFTLRATANNGSPNALGTGELGFLYRKNTGIQIFNNSGTPIATFASTTGGDSFAFYLADAAGTGSPFATGSAGARVIITQGGAILGSYALNAPMSTSRYVTFGSNSTMIGGIDNVAVTPQQTNILPSTTQLNLVAGSSVLQLENVTQTVATLDGVGSSSIAMGPLSRLIVNGSTDSAFAGIISGAAGSVTKTGSSKLTLSGASSYGGVTILSGGILNVGTFSDYGVDGSLGNHAVDAGGESMGLLFRGGTLQYTGSTAQSTNRQIRVNADGGGGNNGGAIIDASGSNPGATLSFTAATSTNFYEFGGNRTLTFTGSNTGSNTFNTAITQTGGATSVVKSGAGKWVLTGASTYKGDTTINGGILSLGSTGAISSADPSNPAGIVFGGGTLQYSASNTTDYSARIESGTSTSPVSIDTNGQDIIFASALTGTKSGGLTKSGAGKLTLGGTNFYTGPTVLTTGTLRMSTGSAISGVDVAAGTSLEVLGVTDGQTLTTDSATFAASNLLVDFNSLANPSVPVVSTGALTLNGNVALSLANVGLLTNGSFPLIQYTSKTGASIFTQSSTSIGPRSSAVVSDTGSNIILTISSDKPKWTGLDSGNWLVGTTGGSSNWKLNTGGTATNYIEGDGVLFSDSATGTRTINISASNVLPASTIFDTAANNYKLTSGGGFGIAGTGPLSKNGSGTVVITTANTYTGPTTINEGTLKLGDGTTDGSIAGTSAIINNGTLVYDNLTDKSAAVVISGTGGIIKSGPGGLALSGANTYEGETILNGGALTLGSTTALGFTSLLTINGGSLDSSAANLVITSNPSQIWNTDILFAGTNSLNLGSGFVTLGGNRQVNVVANTLTVGGAIDGPGFHLTKLGAGTLALGNSNTYDGGTTLAAGIVRLGSPDSLGSVGAITFSGGTLQYGTGNSTDYSDRIASTTSTSPVAIDTNVQAVTFATALNSNQSGGLTVLGHQSGAAILNLTAANSYGGPTLITTDALLRVGADEVIPNGSVVSFSGVALGDHNAKFELQNFNETVGGLTGVSGIVQCRESAGSGTGTLIIDTAGQNYTFEGLIRNQSGVLALVKNGLGTQTITSTTIGQGNNYTGGLTVNGGTMKLRDSGNGRVISALTSNVTVGGTATLALENTLLGNTSTTARIISGAGNVEISSGNLGTISLTGVNTYTGNTTVNGGNLTVANTTTTFADTSTVSIASGAHLNLPNAVTDTVAGLTINGSILPAGLYDQNSPQTSGYIFGAGKLQVGASYSSWASTNVNGDAANVDTDLDGVKNGIEYFMNSPAGFTANPAVTAGPVRTITWLNGGNIPFGDYGTQFVVQTSVNLASWTNVLSGDASLNNTSGSVIYTLPNGAGAVFVRLVVTPN
ncbi:MAG: autotransporter-associated beta strand repeat-containing protein [Luteolibacter sp.]|uniref:autotransporter-associated beta strand repeat-containing protein n=1 Tax=Luteolibacter sp. TaxID=1962973 RepID=UPI003264DA2D